eukprot:3154895-Lingulodinium_polyedra.AAC.1
MLREQEQWSPNLYVPVARRRSLTSGGRGPIGTIWRAIDARAHPVATTVARFRPRAGPKLRSLPFKR